MAVVVSLDTPHVARIKAILDALPADTDLVDALLALEDAYVCCEFAVTFRLTFERARELITELLQMREL